jgi:hypothetical protein
MRITIPIMAMLFPLLPIAFGAGVKDTVLIPRDNGGKPTPRFSNGFTIFYDPAVNAVLSYGSGGGLKTQVALSLPESSRLTFRDAVATRDGNLAIAASGSFEDQQKLVSIILWVSHTGNIDRVVRTPSFAPVRLVFAPDGNLWTLGKVYDETFKETPEHEVVRGYDQQGKLIKTLLPVQSFKNANMHPAAGSFLVANAEKVGMYSPTAREYVEFDVSGENVRRWTTPELPSKTVVLACGLTNRGDLYIGGVVKGKDGPVTYRLDRTSGDLAPIRLPDTAGASRVLSLLGTIDNDLVLYSKPVGITRFSLE